MKSKHADDHLHEKVCAFSTNREPTSEGSGNERKRTPSIAMRYCRFGPYNASTINELIRTSKCFLSKQTQTHDEKLMKS